MTRFVFELQSTDLSSLFGHGGGQLPSLPILVVNAFLGMTAGAAIAVGVPTLPCLLRGRWFVRLTARRGSDDERDRRPVFERMRRVDHRRTGKSRSKIEQDTKQVRVEVTREKETG